MRYAAFLLGINLGTRTVKMPELKALMEKLGYKDVATVLASGNVVFSGTKQKPEALAKRLETAYEKKFGFKIGTIVRTGDEIENIGKTNPFKKIKMTKDIRRYVTFLSEKPQSSAPPESESVGFKILKVTNCEAYSVLDLSKFAKTPDVMKLLGQTYGKPARPGKITTRNWNTIEKIAALL